MIAEYIIPKKHTATEHYSFWLRPDTMQYIRTCNKATRISQGQILQIIVDYFRLTRRAAVEKLSDEDQERLKTVKLFLRIIPL